MAIFKEQLDWLVVPLTSRVIARQSLLNNITKYDKIKKTANVENTDIVDSLL